MRFSILTVVRRQSRSGFKLTELLLELVLHEVPVSLCCLGPYSLLTARFLSNYLHIRDGFTSPMASTHYLPRPASTYQCLIPSDSLSQTKPVYDLGHDDLVLRVRLPPSTST